MRNFAALALILGVSVAAAGCGSRTVIKETREVPDRDVVVYDDDDDRVVRDTDRVIIDRD